MQLVKLNLARNCLKYIIKAYGIKEIFIPYYSCQTLWIAAREEKCKVKFYHIDNNFMPAIKFPKEAYIVYINYFGLCTENCKNLAEKYKNLIIDNTHSFYSQAIGLSSFNSLRKFFYVQNGAYLYTNKILNENIPSDDLKLTPSQFHNDTEKFIKNELILNKEKDIKYAAPEVITALSKINFEKDKKQRIEIFNKYSKAFDKFNKITLKLTNNDVPYCYPFCPNCKVDIHDLTILRLWKPLPKNFVEHTFLNNTMALPLNDDVYADKIIKTITL